MLYTESGEILLKTVNKLLVPQEITDNLCSTGDILMIYGSNARYNY